MNEYFEGVATDPNYNHDKVMQCERQAPRHCNCKALYTCDQATILLSNITRTSPGSDCIPHWVYRYCASKLFDVVCKFINIFIKTGCVPCAWRTAIITSVSKALPVSGPSDYWPISVTPILSRVVERLVVKNFIAPLIPAYVLGDQFGFKPTGSTTAALIDLTHIASAILEDNRYVRCLLVDVFKAFYSVDHCKLINKLKGYNTADNVIQWVVSFLSDRDQFTKFGRQSSIICIINRSIVQGSGIGPTLFIIFIADLRPGGKRNKIVKYADDASLLVP